MLLCASSVSVATAGEPLPRMAPGTAIESAEEGQPGNRVVLLAQPRINSGQTDAVGSAVAKASTQCALTIMAEVAQASDKSFELKRVSVGYCLADSQSPVAIDSDSASELGVTLGFIARQVLRTNEQGLEKLSVVGRSDRAVIFDAPSIMFRRAKHRRYVTRHLVSIDTFTGQGMLHSWLMVPPKSETPKSDDFVLINHPIRSTDWGTREVRRIHIDGDAFNFLGVPGETAFALEDLPPGDDLSWNASLYRLGRKAVLQKAEVDQLADLLWKNQTGQSSR
ncbi:MAG: hypothetical protein AAFV88_19150 [Planctomycetota bacterium]